MIDMDAAADDLAPGASGWRAWWSRALASVRSRNSRGWYFGASFGLVYQIILVITIWTAYPWEPWRLITTSVLLLFFYAGFMLLPPMSWAEPRRFRLIVLGAYWAYTTPLFVLIGPEAFWLWLLVAAVAAILCEEVTVLVAIVAGLVAGPLIYAFATNFRDSIAISAPIIFGVAAMMFGVNRWIRGVRELRQAQGEVARLAVVEERARFSRDMHDVLGHSLTVVTVKSELARRLVAIDPDRAEEEIADIERLSRAALADLRAAVAGYREMTVQTELGAAQAALAASDIELHLPTSSAPVNPQLTEVFGWVLREAVTNVVRHSGARNCWVNVTRTELTVDDDGHGLPHVKGERGEAAGGTGLLGLRERAHQAGAELLITESSHGGVQIAIRRTV